MSWHFSNAMIAACESFRSLRGQAAAFLAECSSDGKRSAPLRSIPFALNDSCSGKMRGTFHRSPYGTMFVHSTDFRGRVLLTWFLGAFRAKTLAVPDAPPGLKAREVGSGERWPESFTRYSRNTSSWRTAPCSRHMASTTFSGTWPRWGSMRAGVCFRLPPLERPTFANASGLLPTTRAADGERGGGKPNKHCLLPTPTVKGNYNKKGAGKKSGDGLATALTRFRTPLASDCRSGQHKRWGQRKNLNDQIGGQLNPTWVEWLMGWPIGWTGFAPLETVRFRQWLRAHGAP